MQPGRGRGIRAVISCPEFTSVTACENDIFFSREQHEASAASLSANAIAVA